MEIIFVTILIAVFAIPPAYLTCNQEANEGCGKREKNTRSLYSSVAWLDGIISRNILQTSDQETVDRMKSTIQFYLYNDRSKLSHVEVATLDSPWLFQFFNPRLPTKILIHGFLNDISSPFNQNTKNAYLNNFHSNINVICVDWRNSSFKAYHHAKEATLNVAAVVAQFIDRLSTEYGNKNWRIHLIGHSLGAHISGVAARLVKSGRIPRITGLDPAQPLYDMDVVNERLGTDAAEFVEVLHTGGKRLGTQLPLGHVDLYPNGGDAVQRGCGNDVSGVCSHSRAYEIYQEALHKPNAFVGFACTDWDTFRTGACLRNKRYAIGENVNTRARGLYFFRTADGPPYGLGDQMQAFSNSAILEDKTYQAWASTLFGWLV